ncbi:MAG: hypothetical protein HEP71_23295 [Roseivirga sp.]|nr:hypothetical protein [Roseivirga sp.]
MGEVKERALFKKASEDCEMMMMEHHQKGDCCEDEWHLQKVENDHQVSYTVNAPNGVFYLLYDVSTVELPQNLAETNQWTETNINGPPDIQEPPLFILFHSLKIPTEPVALS